MAGNQTRSQAIDTGEQIAVFGPSSANIVAGFIISVLLFALGGAVIGFPLRDADRAGWNLPVTHEKGLSWATLGGFATIGIIFIALGVACLVYTRSLIGHRVEFYANGFRYGPPRAVEWVLWAQVRRIEERIVYERHPVLKFPANLLLPKVASYFYFVVTVVGKEYGFNGTEIKAIRRLGKLLREQAKRLSLQWETVEVHTSPL